MKQRIYLPAQLTPILQTARKAANVRQGDLALLLGRSQASLSRLELQPENMKVSQLITILNHLGLEMIVQEKGQAFDQADVHMETDSKAMPW